MDFKVKWFICRLKCDGSLEKLIDFKNQEDAVRNATYLEIRYGEKFIVSFE